MSDSDKLQWLTLPGTILSNISEAMDIPSLRANSDNNGVTSFIKDDVICFDGNESVTFVAVNRLNPIWHQLDYPISEFRKVFFQ